jgi:hypothetical protein
MTLKESFEQFVKERQYLKNVTPRTIEYYWDCFRAWERCGPDPKTFVVKMRDGGARASTVNCVGRGLNAYFKWAELGGILANAANGFCLPAEAAARNLFDLVIGTMYLMKNPQLLTDFIEFGQLTVYKLMQNLRPEDPKYSSPGLRLFKKPSFAPRLKQELFQENRNRLTTGSFALGTAISALKDVDIIFSCVDNDHIDSSNLNRLLGY